MRFLLNWRSTWRLRDTRAAHQDYMVWEPGRIIDPRPLRACPSRFRCYHAGLCLCRADLYHTYFGRCMVRATRMQVRYANWSYFDANWHGRARKEEARRLHGRKFNTY